MRRKKSIELKHLIYVSQRGDIDHEVIEAILKSSRKNNIKTEITGALIYGDNLYLQFLEGPVDSIEKTFKKIKEDRRHTEVNVLKNSVTDRRLFASWTMRDDSLANWMWSNQDIKTSTIRNLKPEQAYNVFSNLSRELDQFID